MAPVTLTAAEPKTDLRLEKVNARVVGDADEQPGLLPKLRVTSPETKLMRKTLFSEVRTAPHCDREIVVKVVGMMPRESRA